MTSDDLTHPEAVARALRGPDKVVGLLHDAVEDGHVAYSEIYVAMGGSTYSDAIYLLTHRKHHDYDRYIERICQAIRGSEGRRDAPGAIAGRVKLADLRHNLSRMDEAHEHNRGKYERAIESINEACRSLDR